MEGASPGSGSAAREATPPGQVLLTRRTARRSRECGVGVVLSAQGSYGAPVHNRLWRMGKSRPAPTAVDALHVPAPAHDRHPRPGPPAHTPTAHAGAGAGRHDILIYTALCRLECTRLIHPTQAYTHTHTHTHTRTHTHTHTYTHTHSFSHTCVFRPTSHERVHPHTPIRARSHLGYAVLLPHLAALGVPARAALPQRRRHEHRRVHGGRRRRHRQRQRRVLWRWWWLGAGRGVNIH